MKKWILFLMLGVIGMRGMGQVPTWQWARQGFGHGEGNSISVDINGNVYFTGGYSGSSIIFGNDTLINPNSNTANIFLAKYDISGNFIWSKNEGGSGGDVGNYVATDELGNAYVTGYFGSSSITFGTFTLINNGFFLCKYDSLGNVIWARSANSNSSGTTARCVTTNNFNSIYVVGDFTDSLVVFGTDTLFNSNPGTSDIFIVKYDSAGSLLWVKSEGGINLDYGMSAAVTKRGYLYISGSFIGPSITFGNFTLFNANPGYEDFYLTKFDSIGNVIWAKSAGSTGSERGLSVVADNSENAYVSGFFDSPSLIFGLDTLINSGGSDVFIVKYDKIGNVSWTKSGQGLGDDWGWNLAIDSLNNTYMSGGFSFNNTHSISFDTILLQYPIGTLDPMFIVKYNRIGNAIWAKVLGSGGDDANGIAIGPNNSVYIGGDFMVVNPFILGNDSLILNVSETPFLAKLGFRDVGIPQISTQPATSLFPNPFSTTATLVINGEIKDKSYLYIFNLLGQEVKTIPIINQNEITINRDNLPDGMYFYKIIGNKNETIAVGKMVIN